MIKKVPNSEKFNKKDTRVRISDSIYNNFTTLVKNQKQKTGKKTTTNREIALALSFFTDSGILPSDYLDFGVKKEINNIETEIKKLRDQHFSYAKVFENNILKKLDSIKPNSELSHEDFAVLFGILNKKFDVVNWLFFNLFDQVRTPSRDISFLKPEFKKRLEKANNFTYVPENN